MNENEKKIRLKLSGILPLLNEKQKRLLVGAEALSIGYGGIKVLSNITGMSCPTIRRGIDELKKGGKDEIDKVRTPGGGRKKAIEINPKLKEIIEDIIEPETRGDPESSLRWTCKSIRNIADLLKEKKYQVSHQTVASILHGLVSSLLVIFTARIEECYFLFRTKLTQAR